MSEYVIIGTGLLGVLISAIVFGFVPGALMRQVVRLWPKEHPRRAELIAEVYVIDYGKRLLFLFSVFEMGLFEGVAERLREVREARRAGNVDDEPDPAPVDDESIVVVSDPAVDHIRLSDLPELRVQIQGLSEPTRVVLERVKRDDPRVTHEIPHLRWDDTEPQSPGGWT